MHPPHDPRTMRERMLAGDPYRADDPELQQLAAHAAQWMDRYNQTARPADQAHALLTQRLASVGPGTVVRPPFYIDYGQHITLGARTFANFGLVALDVAPITIGDDVLIATNVQLLTATHPTDPIPRRDKWETGHPITIGDNAWIGAGTIVLPGVTIGRDTVVGAGSVVTRDLPPAVVAVGNPARVVRDAQ